MLDHKKWAPCSAEVDCPLPASFAPTRTRLCSTENRGNGLSVPLGKKRHLSSLVKRARTPLKQIAYSPTKRVRSRADDLRWPWRSAFVMRPVLRSLSAVSAQKRPGVAGAFNKPRVDGSSLSTRRLLPGALLAGHHLLHGSLGGAGGLTHGLHRARHSR